LSELEPVRGRLVGHLTERSLAEALENVTRALHVASRPVPVLLDCTGMEGYELDARHAFVAWNQHERERVSRLAIVTENRLWHVVITAMALASGQRMMGFTTEAQARLWLTGTA
jgi:hypothetical protein